MFGFGHSSAEKAHEAVYGGQHEGSLTHELLAGAASFEAMRMYEQRQREQGEEVSHGFAKEMLAAFVGAEVDKLFETKGLDYLDRDEAKRRAMEQAQALYDERYGG
jgi:hypothetical protein